MEEKSFVAAYIPKLVIVCSKWKSVSLACTHLEIRGNDRVHSPPLLSWLPVLSVLSVLSMRYLMYLPVPVVHPTRHARVAATRTSVKHLLRSARARCVGATGGSC